jgi:transcriptional regulator with XRE-family HTH domain
MASEEAYVYALVLGRVIAGLRERKKISQGELAERVGITQPTLSRIERGQGQPDAFTLTKIADVLGVSVGELMAYVEKSLARTEHATRSALGTTGQDRKGTRDWWETAITVAGAAGLAGLVAFSVAAALKEKPKPPKR